MVATIYFFGLTYFVLACANVNFFENYFSEGGVCLNFQPPLSWLPPSIKIHSMGLYGRYKMDFDEYLSKYHDRSFIRCVNQYFPANLSDD